MEGTSISFVTYPDGKVSQASLTVGGERNARERVISEWLPEQYFGNAITGYLADSVWREMSAKGFKSWTVGIADDGSPQLDEH